MKQNNLSDSELLSAFYESGENRYLGFLLERYTYMLIGVCMKYLKNEEDARDSVQQVFEKALLEIPKYKVDYFKSWVYMVAKNHCLMQLRDKKRFVSEVSDETFKAEDNQEHLLKLVEKDKNLQTMEEALQSLNHEQNLCITLFYLQKKTYNQIVEQTGMEYMQVKSSIQNGKRNLKLLMERMPRHEQ